MTLLSDDVKRSSQLITEIDRDQWILFCFPSRRRRRRSTSRYTPYLYEDYEEPRPSYALQAQGDRPVFIEVVFKLVGEQNG